MQSRFIYYKSKFVNLHKLTRVLMIRLLVKYTKIKSSQSIQANLTSRPNTLSSIELEEIVSSIRLKFSQAEHVGLA